MLILDGILGKKIGMTQLFSQEGKVVPVTAINIAHCYVTQVKTAEKDGYNAVQVGILRDRYQRDNASGAISSDFLKHKKRYFLCLQEIKIEKKEQLEQAKVGAPVGPGFELGSVVCVNGMTRGLGFQGVIKRWGFARGPESHGSNFHRRPGAIGHLRRQGEIIKGKRLPGHMGNKSVTVRGLAVVQIEKEAAVIFVKGAVPGKKDSVIMMHSDQR